MKARSLENLGVPHTLTKLAKWLAVEAGKAGLDQHQVREKLAAIVADPGAFTEDAHFTQLAQELAKAQTIDANLTQGFTKRDAPAPWKQWGANLEESAVSQMRNAADLPVAVAGALMPDAHMGYGLPIGGVLATENAVIPYAVGVDIACRMKMTVLDLPVKWLESQREHLINAIEAEKRFGMGSEFGKRGDPRKSSPREHDVLDEDWNVSPITAQNRDRACCIRCPRDGSPLQTVGVRDMLRGGSADEHKKTEAGAVCAASGFIVRRAGGGRYSASLFFSPVRTRTTVSRA